MTAAGAHVLVVVASRHGATAEIAEALARGLVQCPAGCAAGLSATVLPARQQPDPRPFDAVVVGSAVYAGRWLDPALQYATQYAGTLRAQPVWLFSSGPIGEPPFPPDEPYDVAMLTTLTGSRAHATFPGRMDPSRLSFGERAMVTAMRAPVGDFRDWDAIAAWAAEIAEELRPPSLPGGTDHRGVEDPADV